MITNYRLKLLILYQILLVNPIVMCREKGGEYATSAPSPSIYISSILECPFFPALVWLSCTALIEGFCSNMFH